MARMRGQRVLGSGPFLFLVIMLGMFGPISTDMYLPALPDMAGELGTDAATLNVTLYGFMLGMAVSILLLGPLSDKYGRKRPLVVTLSLYTAATLGCGLAQDVGTLIVLRMLQSIGAGAAITTSTALMEDCYTGSALVRILNFNGMVRVLGPMLSPVAGAALISVWGWRSTFYAPALIAVVCLALVLLMTETLPEEERGGRTLGDIGRCTKELAADRPMTTFMLMSSMLNLAFMGYLSVSSYIYEDMFGFGESEYSVALASALLFGTFGMAVMNRALRHTRNSRRLPFYAVAEMVPGIIIILFGDRAWWAFFLPFLLFIVGSTSMSPWSMSVMMSSHEGDNGIVSGLINFTFFAFGCLGMMVSTMPWPSYTVALGALMIIGSTVYCLLWASLRAGGRKLRGLELTGSGEAPGKKERGGFPKGPEALRGVEASSRRRRPSCGPRPRSSRPRGPRPSASGPCRRCRRGSSRIPGTSASGPRRWSR